MHGSVLHIAVSIEETLEWLASVSEDRSTVTEEFMSIRIVYGSVNLMCWPKHCL